MRCKYHKQCGLYQSTAVTCQTRNAEEGYCGAYRQFEEVRIAEKAQFKKELRALNAEWEGLFGGFAWENF